MPVYEDEATTRALDWQLMRRLLGYLRPYWRRVAAAVACLVVMAAVDLIGPYLNKIAIDRYLTRSVPPAEVHRGLSVIAWIYVAVIATKYLVGFVQTLLVQQTGQSAIYDIRAHIFDHLQRLPIAHYDRTSVGRMMTRVTTDVDVLNELFASGVVTIFSDVLAMLGVMAIMLRLDWRLALTTFAVIPLVFVVGNQFRVHVGRAYRRARLAIAALNAFMQERFSGVSVVQLFGREAIEFRRFAAANADCRDASLSSLRVYSLFLPLIELLGALALSVILFYGGVRVLYYGLTLGTVVAFTQYCSRFYRPIADMSDKFNTLQQAMASSERIFALLDEPLTVASPEQPKAFPGRGAIEFRNVWFAYGKQHDGEWDWVLRDLSFVLPAGACVAVVGHTGAGKTTLISLLLRYYDVQRGAILFNGTDIRDLDLGDLRRHFAVVSQDPFLFSGTVESNIRLGTARIDHDRVERAARVVGAHDFIAALQEGYGTRLHERGSTLSAGQRQLISFARALAHDPDFLVLDEATSSVDTRTEQMLQQGMLPLLEGRSSLVVAHRLSTIRRADQILVMHRGKLVGQGTHDQLLAQGGIYGRLYALQYQDQEVS